MWSISPLLFGVAVAYAAIGSGLTVLFGRPLIWLNYNQADREASLRGDLVHLRENAESVAVLRREGRIGARLRRRVDESGCERETHHQSEPQPRFLHDRLQLPDSNHPGVDSRAPVHSRPSRVRGDHAIGDGVFSSARRVLAGRDAVPADFGLRGCRCAAVGPRREHRGGDGTQRGRHRARRRRIAVRVGRRCRCVRGATVLLCCTHLPSPSPPACTCW